MKTVLGRSENHNARLNVFNLSCDANKLHENLYLVMSAYLLFRVLCKLRHKTSAACSIFRFCINNTNSVYCSSFQFLTVCLSVALLRVSHCAIPSITGEMITCFPLADA